MLVEHARNLVGIVDASHAEYGGGGTPVITPLACTLVDTAIEVDVVPGTLLAKIHGGSSVTERTNCNYGLAPQLETIASTHGMVVSGRDDTGEVRAVERPDHPFFLATLYQPQRTSSAGAPHPVLAALVDAVIAR